MSNRKEGKGGGARKYGRAKRRAAGRLSPLSKFVRGKISAETYFKQTKQKIK